MPRWTFHASRMNQRGGKRGGFSDRSDTGLNSIGNNRRAGRVSSAMTRTRIARPDDPAARPLLDGLADEYATTYGEKTNGELLPAAVSGATSVAGGGGGAAGRDAAEVKRMWTSRRHRRRRLARRVLAALEHEALQLDYRTLRLQTGALSAPALAVYRASGYERIAPFGRYRDEPLAVAFEKRLADSGERGRTQGFDA